MAGTIWVSDREPGVRLLFGEAMPGAESLDPFDLETRLRRGERPDALVIDGTQLLDLPARLRRVVVRLPRVLVCTGLTLVSMPVNLLAGPGVAVLAKPFCVDDLVAAAEWVSGAPTPATPYPPRRERRPSLPRTGRLRQR